MDQAGNLSESEARSDGAESSQLGRTHPAAHQTKVMQNPFRNISTAAEELHTDHHHIYGHHKQQLGYPQRHPLQKTSTREQLLSCVPRICRSLCCHLCDDIQCIS